MIEIKEAQGKFYYPASGHIQWIGNVPPKPGDYFEWVDIRLFDDTEGRFLLSEILCDVCMQKQATNKSQEVIETLLDDDYITYKKTGRVIYGCDEHPSKDRDLIGLDE